jgi:hypothetical protein
MKKITKEFMKKITNVIGNSCKIRQLIDTGYCHFSYTSAGNWTNNAVWYRLTTINNKRVLLWFTTKWAWDNKTRDLFFKTGQTKSSKKCVRIEEQ